MVGVCEKKCVLGTNIPNLDRTWGVSSSGKVFHPFKSVDPLSFDLKTGSSISVQYYAGSSSQGTLLYDCGQGFKQLFSDMTQKDNPFYLVMYFTEKQTSLEPAHVRLYMHPFTITSLAGHSSFTRLQSQEKLTSGYPHLSPMGATLCHGIVSLLYQLQEKEPWNRALGHVCSYTYQSVCIHV